MKTKITIQKSSITNFLCMGAIVGILIGAFALTSLNTSKAEMAERWVEKYSNSELIAHRQ